MIRQEIIKIIKKSIKEIQKEKKMGRFEIPEIKVESSKEKNYGDYSTNIAIIIAKQIKKNPLEVAEIIKSKVKSQKSKVLSKIEKAGPGFINFWLKEDEIKKLFLKIISSGLKIFQKKPKKREIIVIEYSSPNIAKPLGIHHLRSTIIGQALVNILRFLGHKVISLSFPGDWGTQFGLLIAAYKHWANKKKLEKNPIPEMLKLYVKISEAAKKNPQFLEEGRREFKKLEQGDRENRKLWQWFKKESLKDFNRLYKLLNVRIENTIGESFYEPELRTLIEQALKKGKAEYGEDKSVIVKIPGSSVPEIIQKSDGSSIYTTRELAAIRHRFKKWNASKIIYVAANQQTFHLSQVFGVAEKLGLAKKSQLVHVKFGTMLTPSGKKFATREGKIIPLEQVLKQAIKKAEAVVEKLNPSLAKPEKEKVAKVVGIGAIKFFDLSRNRLRDITFNWEQMLNLKGFSAPYLQYSYSRFASILRKANFKKRKVSQILVSHPLEEQEREMMIKILSFDEVVAEAAQKFLPNLLAEYLYELSNMMNNFYETLPVLKADKNKRYFRLNLVYISKEILKIGLNLLGISVLEKM